MRAVEDLGAVGVARVDQHPLGRRNARRMLVDCPAALSWLEATSSLGIASWRMTWSMTVMPAKDRAEDSRPISTGCSSCATDRPPLALAYAG